MLLEAMRVPGERSETRDPGRQGEAVPTFESVQFISGSRLGARALRSLGRDTTSMAPLAHHHSAAAAISAMPMRLASQIAVRRYWMPAR